MFSDQEKAAIVQEYIRTNSVIALRGFVDKNMDKRPSSTQSIRRWYHRFIETGSVQDLPRCRRPQTSQDRIKAVRQIFTAEPSTSLRNAKTQLHIPRATIQKILRQLLSWYA